MSKTIRVCSSPIAPLFALLCLLLPASAACGGGGGGGVVVPLDVAGDYSINVINRVDGCSNPDWTTGATTTNVPLLILQQGTGVTADLGAPWGAFADTYLGEHIFEGDVSGTRLEMTIYGSTVYTQGNCTYTFNAVLSGRLDGDFLEGTITYQSATNGNPDCDAVECTAVQDFNGTRPPR